jgi:hypothetical protein
MKRAIVVVLLALAVFCLCFFVIWKIVRVFAENAPALEVATAGLAFALSLAVTRHIVRDVMDKSGRH